ncbi:hypothetical protein FACS189452_09850 [Bacteroidia bacterium]|nr:hypothetical protein FACS189452_09850 [Bacteroidia bacterium]GHT81859.1 hypothetical protein FACS189467_6570 [Bacteroidia bacterium]
MENPYKEVPTTNGRLRYHIRHGRNERAGNIRIAKYFVEKYGQEIDLLPVNVNGTSADAYNHTLGIEQEYKINHTPTQNAINKELRSAQHQANNIVIEILSDISDSDLRDSIQDRVLRTPSIQSVTILRNGNDTTYRREQIIQSNFTLLQ